MKRLRRRGMSARSIQSGVRMGILKHPLGKKYTAKEVEEKAKTIQAMRDSAAATERSMRERGEL